MLRFIGEQVEDVNLVPNTLNSLKENNNFKSFSTFVYVCEKLWKLWASESIDDNIVKKDGRT